MPDPAILLWADCESTGVLEDPETPTVLEFSWALSTTDGDLLTPVRQRFTCLAAATHREAEDGWEAVAPIWTPSDEMGRPGPDAQIRWCAEHDDDPDSFDQTRVADGREVYPVPFVRQMHDGNGLARAFASYAPVAGEHVQEMDRAGVDPDEIVTNAKIIIAWAQLDEMMRADLDAAGVADLERGQVILAGGGVSHYENRFVRRTCPRTFDRAFMHYSAGADLSTVLRTLTTRLLRHATPQTHLHRADNILDWARRNPSAVPIDWRNITLAEDTGDARTPWADPDRPDDPAATYLDGDADNHRAVAGVVRALAAYRVLPYAAEHMLTRWADADDISAIGGREARR